MKLHQDKQAYIEGLERQISALKADNLRLNRCLEKVGILKDVDSIKLYQRIEILKTRKDNLSKAVTAPANQVKNNIQNSIQLLLNDLVSNLEGLFWLYRFESLKEEGLYCEYQDYDN